MDPTEGRGQIGQGSYQTATVEHSSVVKDMQVEALAKKAWAKYPPHSKVKKLPSPFKIKQIWLYNEWDSLCKNFSGHIQPSFPNREDLHPKNKNPNVTLIQSVFDRVRGNYSLWQTPREEGSWEKVKVKDLGLDWVMENVEILFPSQEEFPVSKLKGIVLWDDMSKEGKRYKLLEGNHRISAWLAAKDPPSLPATIYIGKPKKSIKVLT